MDEQLGVTIACRIATRDGVDPVALEPPLYDAIDVDALEQLIQPDADENAFDGSVSFEYRGYSVTVEHTGEISISPAVTADDRMHQTGRATSDRTQTVPHHVGPD